MSFNNLLIAIAFMLLFQGVMGATACSGFSPPPPECAGATTPQPTPPSPPRGESSPPPFVEVPSPFPDTPTEKLCYLGNGDSDFVYPHYNYWGGGNSREVLEVPRVDQFVTASGEMLIFGSPELNNADPNDQYYYVAITTSPDPWKYVVAEGLSKATEFGVWAHTGETYFSVQRAPKTADGTLILAPVFRARIGDIAEYPLEGNPAPSRVITRGEILEPLGGVGYRAWSPLCFAVTLWGPLPVHEGGNISTFVEDTFAPCGSGHVRLRGTIQFHAVSGPYIDEQTSHKWCTVDNLSLNDRVRVIGALPGNVVKTSATRYATDAKGKRYYPSQEDQYNVQRSSYRAQ